MQIILCSVRAAVLLVYLQYRSIVLHRVYYCSKRAKSGVEKYIIRGELVMLNSKKHYLQSITPTVVGVYRDWPGSSALNLYI